jgi:hypothetical protein
MCGNNTRRIFLLIFIGSIGLGAFLFLASIFEQEVEFKNFRNSDGEAPNGDNRNLIHFLQVSDIHVSKFHQPQRIIDFEKFW